MKFLTRFTSLNDTQWCVISEVSKIYKEVRLHIDLQMSKRKFISVKYTRRYSYAKFGTFLAPPCIEKTTNNLFNVV